MDIQWVILARGCKLNQDKTIDINNIFHHISIKGVNKATFQLIAKVIMNPIEVGESKKVSLRITNNNGNQSVTYNLTDYVIPDIEAWATSTPYITVNIEEQLLPTSGEYSFELLVDGEYKNGEYVGVTYLKGG